MLTHLDLDHAGGLSDFPDARVHLLATEHAAGLGRATLREKLRYLPTQWAHGPRWTVHSPGGEPWRGFQAVRALPGLPPELLLVPLGGHTRGHTGVAVDTGRGWLLHAGDLYMHRATMSPDGRPPPGIAMYEGAFAFDRAETRANQARVRELARSSTDLTVFSSHDADEFAALAH